MSEDATTMDMDTDSNASLAETLALLMEGQQGLDARLRTLLTRLRQQGEPAPELKTLQEKLPTLLQQVTSIHDHLAQWREATMPVDLAPLHRDLQALRQAVLTPRPRARWLPTGWRRWGGIGLTTVLLSSGLGWWLGSSSQTPSAEAQLMRSLDSTLLTRKGSLPADVLKALDALYTQHGFTPLGKRKEK
jgi:hypothetical protein